MLKKIRVLIQLVVFIFLTLLFLDISGILHRWFEILAKLQFVPAILSLNFVIVVIWLLLSLFFGRIYCSTLCPLGTLQDIFSHVGGYVHKHRFSYVKEYKIFRYVTLAIFIILLVIGLNGIASLVEPYSAFGRIATFVFSPIYNIVNNMFAMMSERLDNYSFYRVDVFKKANWAMLVSVITLIFVFIISLRKGRVWCNTVCPVGTLVGLIAKISVFKVRFDEDKCIKCGICSRNCKSRCIDVSRMKVDDSRCVVCLDCIDNCPHGALKFAVAKKQKDDEVAVKDDVQGSVTRRTFLSVMGMFGASMVAKSQKEVDGGLAKILGKEDVSRRIFPVPPGATGIKNFYNRCTSCQLCVSSCPNDVLKPSNSLETFMQPFMSYVDGYCRPECTICSQVCPSGAITKIDRAEKASVQIGHAKWSGERCLAAQGVRCNNCEHHCPAEAIIMVKNEDGFMIPSVDVSRCIGCGACENLCPVRPYSAIYVEGYEVHGKI